MNKVFSFSKKNRIRKKSEFKTIYTTGQKFFSDYYCVFFKSSVESRLGISIPKRFGKAVYRNHQKRILREAFRKNKFLFKIPKDIVVVMKNKPESKAKQREDIERILKWLSQ